jgi:hypothetical protein
MYELGTDSTGPVGLIAAYTDRYAIQDITFTTKFIARDIRRGRARARTERSVRRGGAIASDTCATSCPTYRVGPILLYQFRTVQSIRQHGQHGVASASTAPTLLTVSDGQASPSRNTPDLLDQISDGVYSTATLHLDRGRHLRRTSAAPPVSTCAVCCATSHLLAWPPCRSLCVRRRESSSSGIVQG